MYVYFFPVPKVKSKINRSVTRDDIRTLKKYKISFGAIPFCLFTLALWVFFFSLYSSSLYYYNVYSEPCLASNPLVIQPRAYYMYTYARTTHNKGAVCSFNGGKNVHKLTLDLYIIRFYIYYALSSSLALKIVYIQFLK